LASKQKQDAALAALLVATPSGKLADLLVRLAAMRPDVRRECFHYLQKHVPLSDSQQKQSEGEVLLALWSELAPDLSELDDYGGGDYDQADQVASLLYEIEQKLSRNSLAGIL
jgi:hypothetical protein